VFSTLVAISCFGALSNSFYTSESSHPSPNGQCCKILIV
jgi:hypothetical protein